MMHNFFTKLQKLLLTALLCFLIATPALAASVSSAPLTSGSAQNGMVRVKLQSLGSPSSLTLTVNGSYTVNGQSSRAIAGGSKVTVKAISGGLSLTVNGTTTAMGTSFRLRRHATGGQNGVKIAQARVPGNLYPGDFTFSLSGSSITVVASIYMEDYLYGVLPYEMGDQSGLEALKAQAVAARTYTLRAMKNNAGRAYDVVDTTADQVYNGTPSGSANCKKAVDATKGIVLKNGSAFTATYYTASNGGQTESLKNAWGVGNNAALTVKDDPFDLKNSASAKKTFTVNASGAQKNAALNTLLQRKAAAVFGSGAAVTAVHDVSAHTPRYAAPSKLYTKLTFSVTCEINGAARTGDLTFDIFSELEGPLSMSINSMKNELWSVERTASGFTVSARRYGHGIGMSQRGAMQMAREGYTYDQILGFYYTGCTRVQYTLNRTILSAVSANQKSREQTIAEQPADITPSSPSVSEEPDISQQAAAPAPASAALTAKVNTPKGSLNLRKSAKDTAKVLRTVPQGDTVTVLKKGSKWCTVTYQGITGFVMTRYLSFDPGAAQVPAAAASSASPAASASGAYARVTTPKGSLRLRKAAQSNGKILLAIPQNETVSVVKKNVKWTKVTYGGVTGFVMTKYLTFTDQPAPAAAAVKNAAPDQPASAGSAKAASARVSTKNGSLYLRKTMNGSSKILASIPQGAEIPILSKGSKWCKTSYDGKTGYVMTKYLSFSGASEKQPASAAEKASVAASASPKEKLKTLKTAVLGKIVTRNGNKLNLRADCETDATVLRQMPDGDFLTIIAVGDTWCAVSWQDQAGYCKKEFLEFTLYE